MVTKKNKQSNGRTFTLLFDDLPKELRGKYAWTYAAIYRYSKMREGKCRAAQPKLAKAARISLSTYKRAVKWLIEKEYIEDLTPENKASCHTLVINDWKFDPDQDYSPEDNDIQNERVSKKPSSKKDEDNSSQEEDAPWDEPWDNDDK